MGLIVNVIDSKCAKAQVLRGWRLDIRMYMAVIKLSATRLVVGAGGGLAGYLGVFMAFGEGT